MTRGIEQASGRLRRGGRCCTRWANGEIRVSPRGVQAHHLDGYRRANMLPARWQPIGASLPQARTAHRLGERGLNAGTGRIHLPKARRFLLLPARLQSLMGLLRTPFSRCAPASSCIDTVSANRASRTHCSGTSDLDLLPPFSTRMGLVALGSRWPVWLANPGRSVREQSLSLPCLSGRVGQNRTNEIDVLVLVTYQRFCADISRLHQLFRRFEILLSQPLLDGSRHLPIRERRYGRLHIDKHMRGRNGLLSASRRITRFGQMHVVTPPDPLPLFAGLDLGVRGRTRHSLSLGGLRVCSPIGLTLGPVVIRKPDPSEHVHARHLRTRRGGIRGLEGMEPVQPIGSDLLRSCLPLALRFGQASVLHPMAGTIKPVGTDLWEKPLRLSFSPVSERCSQSFSHTLQVGKRTYSRQHMGGSRSLRASSFEPATLFAHVQKSIQQQPLRFSSPNHPPNAERREKSTPAFVHSRPRPYFPSMRSRTALAACRSVRFSAFCTIVTRASCQGASVGCPPTGESLANGSS